MPNQPGDALTAVLGEMADRAGKYADIWQNAAARNATQDYDADAAIADLQKTYTYAVRDMAEVGAAWLEAFAAVIAAPSVPRQESAPKKAAPKKAAPKKAATKKAAASKRVK